MINSNYVTVDLNGFSVTGVNSSGVPAIQVGNTTGGNMTGLCIRNGKVNNWSNGLGAVSAAADGALFEKLIVTDNSDGPGLIATEGCTIKDCIVKNNVVGTNQSGIGGIGIYAGNGCIVVNCGATANGAAGIHVGSGGSLVNCSSYSNGGDGIATGSSCSLKNCSAESNAGFGINAYLACTVSGCAVGSNQNSGINVSDASTVNGCTATFNTHNGIVCSSRCHIINNNCSENDQDGQTTDAGIVATGNGNTIDSNESDENGGNGGGYILSGTHNLLIRNSATANGYNYNVGSANTYGPIINMSSGGVISSASGTVNPWTNWIH